MRIFVSIAILLMIGCDSFDFVRSFTKLEVTDVVSGEPIVGASVAVAGNGAFSADDEVPIPVSPSSELGHTLVPVEKLLRVGQNTLLTVSIELGQLQETIEIPNLRNANKMGELFSVRVVDTSAPPPEIMSPMVVEGSNPPAFAVSGYIRVFEICSNSSQSEIWVLQSGLGAYVETIILGAVPDGFFEDEPNRDPNPLVCQVSQPEDSFTIHIYPVFEDTLISYTYCLDESGAAVRCDESS